MGITGLLPKLGSITRNAHVKDFRGLTVAVDAYVWLHKAVYGCAVDLAQGRPNAAYVRYCEERLDLLLAHGVKPYFVFDGGLLPAKMGKEDERAGERAKARAAGLEALARKDNATAMALLSRAVDVSPQLAYAFVRVLRARGVPFVVAPYEADAQLAYLCHAGIVQAVITEDSDLLPYGAPRVLFKMERDGSGREVARADFPACAEMALQAFTGDMFLSFCVLAGCDYLPSFDRMGIKGAYDMARKCRTTDQLLRMLRFECGDRLPPGYEEGFRRARLTFLHQRVYCPVTRRLTTVTPFPPELAAIAANPATAAALDFLGPLMPDERAQAIAEGRLDPITGEAYLEEGVGGEAAGGSSSSSAGAAASGSTSARSAAGGGSSSGGSGSIAAMFKRQASGAAAASVGSDLRSPAAVGAGGSSDAESAASAHERVMAAAAAAAADDVVVLMRPPGAAPGVGAVGGSGVDDDAASSATHRVVTDGAEAMLAKMTAAGDTQSGNAAVLASVVASQRALLAQQPQQAALVAAADFVTPAALVPSASSSSSRFFSASTSKAPARSASGLDAAVLKPSPHAKLSNGVVLSVGRSVGVAQAAAPGSGSSSEAATPAPAHSSGGSVAAAAKPLVTSSLGANGRITMNVSAPKGGPRGGLPLVAKAANSAVSPASSSWAAAVAPMAAPGMVASPLAALESFACGPSSDAPAPRAVQRLSSGKPAGGSSRSGAAALHARAAGFGPHDADPAATRSLAPGGGHAAVDHPALRAKDADLFDAVMGAGSVIGVPAGTGAGDLFVSGLRPASSSSAAAAGRLSPASSSTAAIACLDQFALVQGSDSAGKRAGVTLPRQQAPAAATSVRRRQEAAQDALAAGDASSSSGADTRWPTLDRVDAPSASSDERGGVYTVTASGAQVLTLDDVPPLPLPGGSVRAHDDDEWDDMATANAAAAATAAVVSGPELPHAASQPKRVKPQQDAEAFALLEELRERQHVRARASSSSLAGGAPDSKRRRTDSTGALTSGQHSATHSAAHLPARVAAAAALSLPSSGATARATASTLDLSIAPPTPRDNHGRPAAAAASSGEPLAARVRSVALAELRNAANVATTPAAIRTVALGAKPTATPAAPALRSGQRSVACGPVNKLPAAGRTSVAAAPQPRAAAKGSGVLQGGPGEGRDAVSGHKRPRPHSHDATAADAVAGVSPSVAFAGWKPPPVGTGSLQTPQPADSCANSRGSTAQGLTASTSSRASCSSGLRLALMEPDADVDSAAPETEHGHPLSLMRDDGDSGGAAPAASFDAAAYRAALAEAVEGGGSSGMRTVDPPAEEWRGGYAGVGEDGRLAAHLQVSASTGSDGGGSGWAGAADVIAPPAFVTGSAARGSFAIAASVDDVALALGGGSGARVAFSPPRRAGATART